MNRRGGQTRIAVTMLVAVALMAPAVVAPVASAAPAVDEYTLNLPGAGGKDHNPGQGGDNPTGDPLPPAVAAQLSESDAALVAIATDPNLGAPEAAAGDGRQNLSPDNRGVIAVVVSAAGGDPLLPLLLVVAVAVIAAIAVTRSRSRAQT